MSYTSLGTDPPNDTRLAPIAFIPSAQGGSFYNMSVCDLQRRLVTAGQRVGLDGEYGPATGTALTNYIKTLPLETIRTVVPPPRVLPVLNTREDYRVSSDKRSITIPAAYHSWLMTKTPSSRQCSTSGATPRTPTPRTPSTPTPDEALPPPPEGGGTGESAGMGAWPWLLAAAAAAAGGGYYWWWRKRKYPGT